MNRTRMASLNTATVIVTQVVSLILKFAVQTVFIHELSQGYLGLNGLFANILSFLSFADLGIGTAITVELYGPIARNDIIQMRRLLALYKKAYTIIAITFTVLGICIAPFVHLFIKNGGFSNTQIMFWFVLYMLGTTATYFAAYKRSFLMASQRGYLSTLNDFSFRSIQQILQIIAIVTLHSFLTFLLIQLLSVVASNIQISRMTSRRFPDVFSKDHVRKNGSLGKEMLSDIKRNVVGAVSSNIGTIIVFGTDNVILSSFVGLGAVARYSNYSLITQSLNSIFSQALKQIVSSIGNLNVTSDNEKKQLTLLRMLFFSACINLVLISGLGAGINIFIHIWAGKNYLLNSLVVFVFLLNFLVTQFRYTAQNFISGMGLYWPLRWKSVLEAGVNLVFSLLFVVVLKMSVLGVVLGTLISNMAINVWWEPLIVYKYGIKKGFVEYLRKYFWYMGICILVLLVGTGISIVFSSVTLIELVFIEVIFELLSVFFFILLTRKSSEYRFFIALIKKYCVENVE
ncbi:lipopolysaccharide biosynthesis protein [Lacticaseibacillus pantheris]|uniref:lipopolysaccharide biosynthesis protein n=1 Tax=Lacticaseibacillus pantheris TaxID=171523 RepID=UPI00265B3F57|nr:hypothetical protein [Lacticaseibacillus pantheris]WKF84157.1 hypothetical protein QY874_07610 [Lacticaseibacillus pantheris]